MRLITIGIFLVLLMSCQPGDQNSDENKTQATNKKIADALQKQEKDTTCTDSCCASIRHILSIKEQEEIILWRIVMDRHTRPNSYEQVTKRLMYIAELRKKISYRCYYKYYTETRLEHYMIQMLLASTERSTWGSDDKEQKERWKTIEKMLLKDHTLKETNSMEKIFLSYIEERKKYLQRIQCQSNQPQYSLPQSFDKRKNDVVIKIESLMKNLLEHKAFNSGYLNTKPPVIKEQKKKIMWLVIYYHNLEEALAKHRNKVLLEREQQWVKDTHSPGCGPRFIPRIESFCTEELLSDGNLHLQQNENRITRIIIHTIMTMIKRQLHGLVITDIWNQEKIMKLHNDDNCNIFLPNLTAANNTLLLESIFTDELYPFVEKMVPTGEKNAQGYCTRAQQCAKAILDHQGL